MICWCVYWRCTDLFAALYLSTVLEHTIQQAGSKNHYKKLITRLEVEAENIDFEVDTGAELSTIP